VRITADTILLVRVLVQDDREQARAAMDLLRRAVQLLADLGKPAELLE